MDDQASRERLENRIAELERQLEAGQEELDRLRAGDHERRMLLQNIPDFIMLLDLEARITYINRSTPGMTVQEVIGKCIYDFLPPQQFAITREAIRRVIEHVESVSFETLVNLPDGTSSYFLTRLGPIVKDGRVQAISQISTSIDERKNAELALAQSESRYRTIFEYTYNGIAVYEAVNDGEDFIFKDFNRSGEKIDKVRRETLIGKSVLEKFPAIKEFGLFEVLQRVWRTGEPEHYPVAAYQDERILGWRENFVYKLPSGEIVAVYADETQRKQMEINLQQAYAEMEDRVQERTRELQETNQRLKNEIRVRVKAEEELRKLIRAVEQSPATVVITDTSGNIEYVNPKFENLTGYSAREVLGRNPRVMKAGNVPAAVYRDLWQTILSGREWRGELCNCKKNGEIYWEMASIAPVKNAAGQITHFVAVKEDITQQRKSAVELEKAKEAADAANQAKSAFLANMSHELRTPLNAVIGFSEVLSDRLFGELNAKQAEYTRLIEDAGRHLLNLINDVLDISKIESGKMELELEDVHLASLIQNALALVREKALKHGIEVAVDIAAPLADIVFTADARKLKQVIFNLLSNAVKFTSDGGHVRVSVIEDQAGLRIVFADDGMGIAADEIDKIFEVFYRTATAKEERKSGTGLGLPLSKKIVELHGGALWAESDGPGKGSRFILTLPQD